MRDARGGPLPIDSVLPEITGAVARTRAAVVVAPPGAGKTTRVPLALLASGILGEGQLILLEPRRVAARAAARRMAAETGTALGDLVGYHIRFDRVAGPRTRILVVTEGLLVRRLQDDPLLEGVAAVVLDEFHERSLHADLALAFAREVRAQVRPDLAVVVMSATFDPGPVASFLGDCPVVRATGRTHPVEIEYLAEPDDRPAPEVVATAVRRVLAEPGGDVLVFLPGAGEISRTAALLEGTARERGVAVLPLHGDLPAEDQDRALLPGGGRRVILATNVAETSLTIEGVTTVVDSGLVRRLRHDPDLGLDRLELRMTSKASADQRAGRAGRTGPGRALRLWTRARHRELEDVEVPEVRRVDLAPTLLELRAWGSVDPARFEWFEAPAPAELERARVLLDRLGAVPPGAAGLTPVGRVLLRLPVPPRLGRLLVEAHRRDLVDDGALLAALASERDIVRAERAFGERRTANSVGPSDLLLRFDLYRDAAARDFREVELRAGGLEAGAVRAVARVADQLRRIARSVLGKERARGPATEDELLEIVLAGFPDRVARRRAKDGTKALMVGGRGVEVAATSVVRDAPYFVAVQAQAGRYADGAPVRVTLASAIRPEWLAELFPGSIRRETTVRFEVTAERVVAEERVLYLDLQLEERRGLELDPELAARELERAFRAEPARVLALEGALGSFVVRVRCLSEWLPEAGFPSLEEAALVDALAELCPGRRSFAELREAPLLDLLRSRLSRSQLAMLDAEAPERLPLPEGRSAPLRYEVGRPPVLSAKVQHLFGVLETPTVARGRIKCQVELLAPNQRPVQVTQDLGSFWRRTYAQVRKDLRGRYPKHAWPETPPGL